jgi:NAD-dependent SIR2 family protein deacetylase
MVAWPDSLAREIVKERCVLFLGAGVSSTATNDKGERTPSWSEFLQRATELVTEKKAKAQIRRLLKDGRMLIALQAIRDNCNATEYRGLLDSTFNDNSYKPSQVHKIIYELDARIVITTNFDKIYERYCLAPAGGSAAYKVLNYNAQDFADELRSDTRLIIKAHGSIDQVSEMIFTRSQYHAAKRDHPHFYEVLRAVLLTNTVLFLGSGLEDPDMLLLLEDVRIAGRHEKPHYALTLKGTKNRFLIKDWKDTYNIDVLEYGPAYGNLEPELQSLLDKVSQIRAELNPGLSSAV